MTALLNALGRPDRGAVTARAREIMTVRRIPWREALLAAYAEARAEKEPDDRTASRCHKLGIEADRLAEEEMAR